MRESVAALPPPGERFAGRGTVLRVLVLGGSQGAHALNRALPAAAALADRRLEIRHQAGEGQVEETRKRYREAGVDASVAAFVDDVAAAYGWADVAVCRAGASTVAELAATGVGSILVPYPWAADDHQAVNARYLERRGAACVVPEKGDIAPRIASLLRDLAEDGPRRLEMAEAAWRVGRRDAAERVVACCRESASPPVFPEPIGART